jgi:hypothetical protein
VSAVFTLFGVDYRQWKAVTRTLLRTDFRLPLSDSGSWGRAGQWLGAILFLGLFGTGAAMVVLMGGDTLLTGTLVLTYLSVMLVSTLLTQHGMTLLTTADYAILGPRPVSSRTFLAIRVTNILFHAMLVTALMAYPVVIAYTVAGGLDIARAGAATLAIVGWALAVTLAVVASYGTLLQAIGAARFRRALGYMQLAGGFLAYGGLLAASRAVGPMTVSAASLPDAWWVALIPPAWFASYLELASGGTNSTTLVRAAMSLAALVALAATLSGKLSLSYAARLADLTSTSETARQAVTQTPFFTRNEARAVALLVLAHFRYDLRVRMGVLGVIPLVILYTLLGTQRSSLDLLAMAVLLFPAVLSRYFATSDAHPAAWVYHVTPARHARLVTATKNIAVVYFLVPFLCLVSVLFAWRFEDLWRAVVHSTMLGILSHIALQGSVLMVPRLPFALPPDKTAGSGSLMLWMIVVILGGQGALTILDRWVYVSSVRMASAVVVLAALSWALNRAVASRARHIRF